MVEGTYLNTDMCKCESSQNDESRAQSADSSKAYRNHSAFKLILTVVLLNRLNCRQQAREAKISVSRQVQLFFYLLDLKCGTAN